MSQIHLRKYNQATTINFNLFDLDGVDMSVAATFASGDIKIMKDEGAEANTGSTPTDEGSGYSLALTATEMSAARVMIHLIDQTAPKVWLDTSIVIETYGNASASHAFDLDTASIAQTGDSFARIGAPAGASVSADLLVIDNFVDGIETAVITNAAGVDIAADIIAIKTETALIVVDTAEIGTAGAGLTNIGTIATVTTLTNKTGFSLASTGLDAIVSTATGMVEIAKAIWDRVLQGNTHNINNSAGKRLRQVEAATVVHAGTAQAGTANTITLDTGANATDSIYNGDRITIVSGTGISEHGIVVSYVGATKVATMSENWVITPDATSEFDITPASVDIETWQHNIVTASAGGLPDVNVNEVADTTQTAGDLAAQNETAQADLDIITGASGVNLLTATQSSIDAIEADTADMQPKLGTPVTDLAADVAALNDLSITEVLTTQMTEAYAVDGTAPTMAQALFMIQQVLGEFAISGTTITVKKLDGTTTAATFTLDSSTAPTSSTRAT